MKLVTTTAFALLAVAIAFAGHERPVLRRIALVAVLIVLALAAASAAEYLFHIDMSIDRLWAADGQAGARPCRDRTGVIP